MRMMWWPPCGKSLRGTAAHPHDPRAIVQVMSVVTRILRRAGRALEPLLAPDADDQRRRADRLIALAKEQDKAIRELREQIAAERAELKRMRELRSADVAETRDTIGDLQQGVRRQGNTLARLARSTGI